MLKALSLLILFTALGCKQFIREQQQEYITSRLIKLKSYHGVYHESGLLPANEDLVTEIWFTQPLKYKMTILSPEKFAGSTMIYDGHNLVLDFPKTKFRIQYKNLQPLSEEDLKQLFDRQFNYNMDHYIYDFGAKRSLLGMKAQEIRFRARSAALTVRSGTSQVFDDFSFPLSGDLHFDEGQNYRASYVSVEFNGTIPEETFKLPAQKAETVSEWDMDSKPIEEAAAKKQANFSFALSTNVPGGYNLTKIIRQKGPVPAFLAIYEKKPYFLYVTSYRDYGLNFIPKGRGIQLKDPNNGLLIPNPHFSIYSFLKKGVQYSVSGNAPLDELLNLARGF